MSSTLNSIQNFACILITPRAIPLRSVIAPRNTFPLCQVHIFSTSLSLSILGAAQHFFIIAVATVHQRLFTTPRTTTGWNQSTGRTAWNQSTQARPPEPLIFGRGLLLHTNPVSSSARPQSGLTRFAVIPFIPKTRDREDGRSVTRCEIPGLLTLRRPLPLVIARDGHEATLILERFTEQRLGRHGLDAGIEGRETQLLERISTRGRMRKAPQRVKKI